MLGKIKQLLLEEAQSWVLWLPVFFGGGILIYFALPYEPTKGMAIRCVAAQLALMALGWRYFPARCLAVILLFIGLGFADIKMQADAARTRFIDTNDEAVTISGNITEIGYSNDVPRLTLDHLRIDELGKDLPDKVRLNVRTEIRDKVRVGDRVITDAVLMPPPPPAVIGGYNYARQAYFDGIGATGYTVKKVIKLKWGGHYGILNDIGYIIGQRIYAVLPGDVGGIAAALINGDRSKISDGVNNDFRASGLYHMLSISGLHLVLVCGVFFVAARFLMSLSYRLSEVVPIKKIAAFIALIGGLLYLLISGLQVPAERSFIMAGLILFAVMIDRTVTPLRSVAFSAFVVLLFQPDSIITPSFQMSFAAAAALIAAFEYIRDNHPGFYKYKIFVWVVGAALTSVVAGFATTPYATYHFGRVTNYGLLANMLAMPVTSFLVMPAAVIGVLLMPLNLEWLALKPMGWGLEIIMKIAEYVGGLPGATASAPFVPDSAILFFTAGFLWLILWRKSWRLAGVAPIIIAFIIPFTLPKPDIFVSENGKVYALNNNGRLEFNRSRESFTTKSWLQFFGQQDEYDLTTHNIKGCEFYGQELDCGGNARIIPANSIVWLPDKIESINNRSGRVWE